MALPAWLCRLDIFWPQNAALKLMLKAPYLRISFGSLEQNSSLLESSVHRPLLTSTCFVTLPHWTAIRGSKFKSCTSSTFDART